MTLDLTTILILCAAATLYALLSPPRLRGWLLLMGSLLAVYALQPRLRIPFSDFILPTATIMLTVACWWLTRPALTPTPSPSGRGEQTQSSAQAELHDNESQKQGERRGLTFNSWRSLRLGGSISLSEDLIALALILAFVIGVALTRYLDSDSLLRITSRPPQPLPVLIGLTIAGGLTLMLGLMRRSTRLPVLGGMILLIVALFVVLKAEPVGTAVSRVWRDNMGRDTSLATIADIAGWLGFSYIAFRLIHTLRDRQSGKLPALTLREYVTYVLFFPALIAGPIDRAERFQKDFRALPEMIGLAAPRIIEGSTRIAVGLFKKFVIADSLAVGLSLNATTAQQADSPAGLWLLVYGYALRLFFDFSGYSEIAIGIGILFGIRLPENFDRPYLKSDLASFWQSWHMTLSTWARFYVFTPLTRMLLSRPVKPPMPVIVLLTQLATMVTIGLWHGVTVNFLIWGVWHGIGLFAHKQWSDRTRKWYMGLKDKPGQKRAWTLLAWFVTFHYVALGWVWFALPEVGDSLRVFGGLIGIR